MSRAILLAAITATCIGFAAAPTGNAHYSSANTQDMTKTLLEKLGYAADAKLLIVHADDLGMAHSVDAAAIKAFESGLVSSGSIMVPCPWLSEIAAYAKTHPDADLGLHLTLTSEWKSYRWGPVLPLNRVSSLLDPTNYFFLTETEAAAHAEAKEVEAEIRAQIDRARAFGIRPTHLDSHMGTLYQNKALFEILFRVARENKLPVRVARDWTSNIPFLQALISQNDLALDRIISITPDVSAENWAKFYSDAIKNLQPGITEMIVHLAYDDEEMRAATADHPDWGAAWRQRDFQFVTSDAFRKMLQDNQIKLVTWRQLGKVLYPQE